MHAPAHLQPWIRGYKRTHAAHLAHVITIYSQTMRWQSVQTYLWSVRQVGLKYMQ